MSLTVRRPSRVEHSNPNYGPFSVGDRVLITHSLRGHEGKTGTITAMDSTKQMFPWLVTIDGGPSQLYSGAALRWLEGGAS